MSIFFPPDWRDASAYPIKYNDWPNQQWVWAFLRRNPDYQNDYGFLSQFSDIYRKIGRHSLAQANDKVEFRMCKYDSLPEETVAEYFSRTEDETPYFYSIEDFLIDKKWELLYLADPSNDAGYDCIPHLIELPIEISDFDSAGGIGYLPSRNGWIETQCEPIKPPPEESHEITLRFDLRYSIDIQLENAKLLMQEQKDILDFLQPDYPYEDWRKIRESTGIKYKNLPFYLRTYDARKAGATFAEIGKKLRSYLDEDNAKQQAYNAYIKAEELVNCGYRELMK